MRTHTALHILCGVIFRDYGAQVTGGNMEPLERPDGLRIRDAAQRLRAGGRGSHQRRSGQGTAGARGDPAPRRGFLIPDLIRTKINLLPAGIEQVRVVEIEGLDLQADGGTHVRNTAEVGRLRVTDYKSKGKINKRLYIALDPAVTAP